MSLLSVVLMLSLLLGGCAHTPVETELPTEPEVVQSTYQACPEATATEVANSAANLIVPINDTCTQRWFDAYSLSKVVGVSFEERERVAFGPWTARKDFGAEDASEDGSLTEWADKYFITHSWSDYGQQILQVIPGDKIEVNGKTVTIEDVFEYPKDGYYEQVMAVVGDGATTFQTCVPNADRNRVVFGR